MASFEIVSPKHGVFTVLFDEADRVLIENGSPWAVVRKVSRNKRTVQFYVSRYKRGFGRVKGKSNREYLHWVLMGHQRIDHIDGDPLNNTRENLRPATHAQNMQNQGLKSNNKSGHRGISWSESRQKWCAYARLNYVNKNLGRYERLEDAVDVVRKARLEMMPFTNEARNS